MLKQIKVFVFLQYILFRQLSENIIGIYFVKIFLLLQ